MVEVDSFVSPVLGLHFLHGCVKNPAKFPLNFPLHKTSRKTHRRVSVDVLGQLKGFHATEEFMD